VKVVLTASAKNDLLRIGDYIGKDNPQRPLSFVRELRFAALELGELHEMYPLIRRYKDQRLRRRVHGNYLILFRVDRQVVVVRILHGAMDIDSLLS
jgi:toxin ParE1/3/4